MSLQQCYDIMTTAAQDAAVPLRVRLREFERKMRLFEALYVLQNRGDVALVRNQVQRIAAELPLLVGAGQRTPTVTRNDLASLETVRRRVEEPEKEAILRDAEAEVRARCHAKFRDLLRQKASASDEAREAIDRELLRFLDGVPNRACVPSDVHVKVFIADVQIFNPTAAFDWLRSQGYKQKRRYDQKRLRAFLGKLIDDGISMPDGVIAVNPGWIVTGSA